MSHVLARLERGGMVESGHEGHVAIAGPSGSVKYAVGDPRTTIYPRSVLKPFQAISVVKAARTAGVDLSDRDMAIMCASHQGDREQQQCVLDTLSRVGLDHHALACPPALPVDVSALVAASGEPSALAHNCSGKHAGFLVAQASKGADPTDYLALDGAAQSAVRAELEFWLGGAVEGPGVDGCGAPAWRTDLVSLAAAFARLVDDPAAAEVRSAMRRWPRLVGGQRGYDSQLMTTQPGLVAKRGAEGVFGVGWTGPQGPVGLVVKITDGADRVAGLVAAAVLQSCGCLVPDELGKPVSLVGEAGHASRLVVRSFGRPVVEGAQ